MIASAEAVAMDVRVVTADGVVRCRPEDIPRILERGTGVLWVDVPDGDEQAEFVLGEVFGFHPRAVQDSLQQSHLPQIAYIHILEHSGHMGMREEQNEANHILSQFVDATQKTA